MSDPDMSTKWRLTALESDNFGPWRQHARSTGTKYEEMRRARCENTSQEYTGRPRDSLQKQRPGRTAAVSHWGCFWTPGASVWWTEALGGFLGTDIVARGLQHLHHLHLRHRRQQPLNDQHFGAHGFTRGPFFRCILRAPSSRRVGGPYRHGQLGRNDLLRGQCAGRWVSPADKHWLEKFSDEGRGWPGKAEVSGGHRGVRHHQPPALLQRDLQQQRGQRRGVLQVLSEGDSTLTTAFWWACGLPRWTLLRRKDRKKFSERDGFWSWRRSSTMNEIKRQTTNWHKNIDNILFIC